MSRLIVGLFAFIGVAVVVVTIRPQWYTVGFTFNNSTIPWVVLPLAGVIALTLHIGKK